MGTFATWINGGGEISRFARGLSFGDDEDKKDAALASLRLCWIQAKAQLEHGLKRKTSGLMEELAEGPLDPALQQSLVAAACAFLQVGVNRPAAARL